MTDEQNTLICWRSANHGDSVLLEALRAFKNRKIPIHQVLYLAQEPAPKSVPTVPSPTKVQLVPIGLDDPTRHLEIYSKLRSVLGTLIFGPSSIHINVSPGTPAMHAVWLILHAGGALPPGSRLWSSQFSKQTKRTRLDEVTFEISTYLSEIRHALPPNGRIAAYDAEAKSPARKQSLEQLADLARVPGAPLLILGERGVGKTRLVETIVAHLKGRKKLVTVPCGSLDSTLADSILFGHVKGAFTGADSNKEGLIKAADGGVLFLDEVQDLPSPVQRKLVRFLQDRRRLFRPVGSNQEETANVEVVCASNRSMQALTKSLDLDLLDRISLLTVTIPPLRECREDLPEDWARVWRELRPESSHSEDPPLPNDFARFLQSNPLPGNLRDLQRIALRTIASRRPPIEALECAIANLSENSADTSEGLDWYGKGSRLERIDQFKLRLATWAKGKWGTWREAANHLECDEKTLRIDAVLTDRSDST